MTTPDCSPTARATVIIPTYGYAPYARWAIASAQTQTVRELEICVLCDGSPPETVEMLREIAAEDKRIQVLQFPKAPRTGEIHRALVIPQTTGKIICYLCHDDLWFPRHVEILERLLQNADFGHTLHTYGGLGPQFGSVRHTLPVDIALKKFQSMMLDTALPRNYFGLSYGAHSRAAYLRLEEGWTVTPDGIWTDLHMWRKFLCSPSFRCASHMAITGLHFERTYWAGLYSPDEFEQELGRCFAKMSDPSFLDSLQDQALKQTLSEMEILGERIEQVNRQIFQNDSEVLWCRGRIDEQTSELNSLYASKSWRITKPLRYLAGIARRVGGKFFVR